MAIVGIYVRFLGCTSLFWGHHLPFSHEVDHQTDESPIHRDESTSQSKHITRYSKTATSNTEEFFCCEPVAQYILVSSIGKIGNDRVDECQDCNNTWIFQVCQICAFSPKKPTKRQKFYISRRSRYTYFSIVSMYGIFAITYLDLVDFHGFHVGKKKHKWSVGFI